MTKRKANGARFEWERAIRVLDLPTETKLVAMILATYAGPDGTNVHPGENRLAADCGKSDRTIRRHLATLRRLGLITRTNKGNGSAHHRTADTYDLTLPDDISTKVHVLHDYPGLGKAGAR